MQVFISYAREDKDTAIKLYRDLEAAGVTPWMDEYDLLVGQNWKVAIQKAIEQSHFFLALLSSNSLSKRGYVQKELRRALTALEEMPPTDIFLLPVRLEECRPENEHLQDLHWADLFPDYDAGLAKLLRVFEYKRENTEKNDDSSREPDTSGLRYDIRKKPLTVTDDDFEKVFRLNEDWHPLEYVQNDYHDNGDGTVTDRATGLTWQKSGSPNRMDNEAAKKYVDRLNRDGFAGYSDWRLPTVDELTSLLELKKKNGDLCIDPVFDKQQRWCWSADDRTSGGTWAVYFTRGKVPFGKPVPGLFVRAVRP